MTDPVWAVTLDGPETTDREWALILASGLAWAVGKLEGMEAEAGYAGQVLEHWRNPAVMWEAPEAKRP